MSQESNAYHVRPLRRALDADGVLIDHTDEIAEGYGELAELMA
jgi:hypothetical protein